jgi:hypothetical protein
MIAPVSAAAASKVQDRVEIRSLRVHGSDAEGEVEMKTLLVLTLSFAAISCAQDKKTEQPAGGKKRLESVTWDLKAHKLIWVVQKGNEVDGEFVAQTTDRYEIAPDKAVMEIHGEKRGFTEEEAASLHKLLDTLSLYCAESVVWWDQGQGEKLDPDGRPSKNRGTDPKGQKVDERKPAPKKNPIKDTDLVASVAALDSLR